MTQIKKSLISVLGVSTVLLLTGCGGGGGGSNSASNTTTTKTGYLTDAAISGLPYTCGTQNGITGSTGEFTFEDGKSCSFSFGTSTLTVDATKLSSDKVKVTPFDVTELATDPNLAVRFMQLIQTLDNASDNTIDLSNLSGKSVDLTSALADDTALTTTMETLKTDFSQSKTALVSASEAMTHFSTTHSADSAIIGKIPTTLTVDGFVNPNAPTDTKATEGSTDNTNNSGSATNTDTTTGGETSTGTDNDSSTSTGSNTDSSTVSTNTNAITKASVVDCSTLTTELGSEAVTILGKYNYKKCAMVAGILIANSNETLISGRDITEETQLMADILSELLDNNKDGVIDDPKVVSYLKSGSNGTWMNMQSAANEQNEGTIVEELLPFIGKDMGVKNSWLIDDYASSSTSGIGEKHMLVEEALHLIHMYGYAQAYPSVWGVSNSECSAPEQSSQGCNWEQSTLTKLAWEAMNNPMWYQHGENSLPSNGVITGTCAQPSCAAVEFIMNVVVEYRDIRSNDAHEAFPSTSAAIAEKLNSSENGKAMKAVFDSDISSGGQFPNGMTWNYNPTSSNTSSSSNDNTTSTEAKTVATVATSITTNTQARSEATFATGHTFVSIPAATFTMGDSRYDMLSAAPEHSVTISKEYWMSKNMVTNAEFNTFVSETSYISDLQKDNSAGCYVYIEEDKGFAPTKGRYYANAFADTASMNNHPVVCISYNDAIAYANWLGTKLGLTVALPTEAQWELAAKGTTQRKFPWGDEDPTAAHANFADEQFSINYAGSQQGKPTLTVNDGYGATSPVGNYPTGASPYGVLDMAGNAAEWVLDYYSDYSESAKTDPTGPTTGESRVNRGGNWVDDFSATEEKHTILVTSRASDDPISADDHMGFRIVINP